MGQSIALALLPCPRNGGPGPAGTSTQTWSAGSLVIVDSTVRDARVADGSLQAIDQDVVDLAGAGLAKTACALLTFTGTTPITLDLTNLAAATGVQVAGATSFATWNHIIFNNVGAQPIAVSPGASNPLRTPLGGTGPTHTMQAGDVDHWNSSAGLTVDSTHKTITFTPTSGGSLAFSIGGA